MVRLLHDNSCRNNQTDNSGSTALHYAVDGGNCDIIRYLIGKGLKVSFSLFLEIQCETLDKVLFFEHNVFMRSAMIS